MHVVQTNGLFQPNGRGGPGWFCTLVQGLEQAEPRDIKRCAWFFVKLFFGEAGAALGIAGHSQSCGSPVCHSLLLWSTFARRRGQLADADARAWLAGTSLRHGRRTPNRVELVRLCSLPSEQQAPSLLGRRAGCIYTG